MYRVDKIEYFTSSSKPNTYFYTCVCFDSSIHSFLDNNHFLLVYLVDLDTGKEIIVNQDKLLELANQGAIFGSVRYNNYIVISMWSDRACRLADKIGLDDIPRIEDFDSYPNATCSFNDFCCSFIMDKACSYSNLLKDDLCLCSDFAISQITVVNAKSLTKKVKFYPCLFISKVESGFSRSNIIDFVLTYKDLLTFSDNYVIIPRVNKNIKNPLHSDVELFYYRLEPKFLLELL